MSRKRASVTRQDEDDNDLEEVWDFARVCSAVPDMQVAPRSPEELQQLLLDNWHNPRGRRRVCILGAGFSHGGHTMASGAVIRIDMKHLNSMALVGNPKRLRVQAGATWHQVLDFLERDTDGTLSVAEMQSYGNFSVGGAVSVNCHGRSTRFANVGDTILSLTVQLVSGGEPLVALPGSDLFRGVVGGYGGVAIIVSAELVLVPNILLERVEVAKCAGASGTLSAATVSEMESNFVADALTLVRDPSVSMYNGVIYPRAETVIVHTYFRAVRATQAGRDFLDNPRSGAQAQIAALPRLQQRKQGEGLHAAAIGEFFLRRVPGMKHLRAWYGIVTATTSSSSMSAPQLVWRNWELGYDATELEPLCRWPSTSVLQEYFVHPDRTAPFLLRLQTIVRQHRVNVLNVSLRHIRPTNQDPFLNYASLWEDRMALVLYINIWNTSAGLEAARVWTQLLIDAVLQFGGTYYLPYLPLATVAQFRRAYPRVAQYQQVKRHYDPANLLRSQFLDTYVLA
jgi:FAD/FMN-containing dehydrogenase